MSEPCVCAGTAGDDTNRAVAQELLATPDWGLLAVPLVRAVQNIVQLSTVVKGDFLRQICTAQLLMCTLRAQNDCILEACSMS